jgi:hypothetical protein
MFAQTSLAAFFAACLAPTLVAGQNVFAHVIVGNTAAYDVSQWVSDIDLAASYGIDAFVLNIGTPLAGTTATQLVMRSLRDQHQAGFTDLSSEQCLLSSLISQVEFQAPYIFRLRRCMGRQ